MKRKKMLKRQLFTLVLTFLILGILFRGTYAHEPTPGTIEDLLNGPHKNFVQGYADAWIEATRVDDWNRVKTYYAKCDGYMSVPGPSVTDSDPPHPDAEVVQHMRVDYSFFCQVGNANGAKMPQSWEGARSAPYYDSINDSASQQGSPTGLWATIKITVDAKRWRATWNPIKKVWTSMYLFHDDGNVYQDSVGEKLNE